MQQSGAAQPDPQLSALKVECPTVDWDAPLLAPGRRGAATSATVAEHVIKHMRQIWGFVNSDDTTPPPELIVSLAQAALADKHMPYSLPALQKKLPDVPSAYLEELVSWQADALAVQFMPKQHQILEKNATVPFKAVRQAWRQRRGAFGTVSKVNEAGRIYARKTGTVEELTPELELLAKLPDLPHNVHLRASYEQNRCMHIIMAPWADADLSMFLARPEVLPAWLLATKHQQGTMLISWMNCLAVGLADLHAHRIKHKDIKPSNIILAPASNEGMEVHPVFCDFGLAKQCSQRSRTAGQCGTVFYQAPEQLAGQLAGRKADVFSLGCVLLELASLVASKKRRWLAKRLGQTGFASSAFITGGEFGQHLPSAKGWWMGMKDLLQRMLNKDPQQRPHADEVARDICNLSVAAGLAVRCHHQPAETHDPASASPPASPLDSDLSDSEPRTPVLSGSGEHRIL